MEVALVYKDKVPSKGEDAPPLSLGREKFGLIACFDGMGGAGSATYDYHGSSFSGAWYASRLSRVVLRAHFGNLSETASEGDILKWIEQLAELIAEALARSVKFLDKQGPRLISKMIRRLPTTISGLIYREKENQVYDIISFNLGDSRSYILTSEKGLQPITEDSTVRKKDAYDSMQEGTRIASCLNADQTFSLETSSYSVKGPLLILSATDGAFDYPNHPVFWEKFLFSTFLTSESMGQWGEKLSDFLSQPQDDVSVVIKALGFENFDQIKKQMSSRAVLLEKEYIEPLYQIVRQPVEGQDPELMRREIWNKYKTDYEALLKTVTPEVPKA